MLPRKLSGDGCTEGGRGGGVDAGLTCWCIGRSGEVAGALGMRLQPVSKRLVACVLPLATHRRQRVRLAALRAIKPTMHLVSGVSGAGGEGVIFFGVILRRPWDRQTPDGASKAVRRGQTCRARMRWCWRWWLGGIRTACPWRPSTATRT